MAKGNLLIDLLEHVKSYVNQYLSFSRLKQCLHTDKREGSSDGKKKLHTFKRQQYVKQESTAMLAVL